MKRRTVHELGRDGRPSVHHYEWAAGSHHKVDPAVALAEFRRILDTGADLTPEQLVQESRPDAAPLHPEFTWDDRVAAEQWRENEAAKLLRSHVTVYEIRRPGKAEPDILPPQRTVVKLELRGTDEDTLSEHVQRWVRPRVYAPLPEIMADDEARRLYVRNAWFDYAALRRKYQDVAEFAALHERVDQIGRDLGIAV
jgi:hypothetical protein